MIEHVLRGFSEVGDPLSHVRGPNPESHILGVNRAGRVIVATNAADPAGNEMRVARIFPLHEYAVAAKNGRGAVTLGNFPVIKVDLRKDTQAADDPRDGIPIHLHEIASLALSFGCRCSDGTHLDQSSFQYALG